MSIFSLFLSFQREGFDKETLRLLFGSFTVFAKKEKQERKGEREKKKMAIDLITRQLSIQICSMPELKKGWYLYCFTLFRTKK